MIKNRGIPRRLLWTMAVVLAPGHAALAADGTPVTFASDVAPILQRSCQSCHRPSGSAPMSLLTYQDVRPWARAIKDRVEKRIMPPWHLDKTVGIQAFKNDFSLSDARDSHHNQVGRRWRANGQSARPPAAARVAVGARLESSAADARGIRSARSVIRSKPYTVAPNGLDQWWEPALPLEGLDEPRWLRAAEFKPSFPLGVRVVHHGHVTLTARSSADDANQDGPTDDGVTDDDGPAIGRTVALARYGVGKSWDVFPGDTGMLIEPGGRLRFQLHYFPIGEQVKDDVVEVGLWFYPRGQEPRIKTMGEMQFLVDERRPGMPRAMDLVLPPNGAAMLRGVHVLQRPARIHSFRGHMHMRGKAQAVEAIYPDGRREILSRANWSHNWHTVYLYEDHVQPLLPRGTVLIFNSWYDNTAANPNNPDPSQWVVFGARSVDEMSHVWLGITYLEDAEFERLVAERKAADR